MDFCREMGRVAWFVLCYDLVAAFSFPLIPTETIATLREVVLMPRDLRPVVPPIASKTEDVVVLVHGFFASAGVWRPLRKHLERTLGVEVASFTHAPGARVESIARKLAGVIARLPATSNVHLVGHSLGGVVARWYVQEHGGHSRVTQTISLASPFFGTEVAKRFPFLVGADLHTRSSVLARLRARADEHDVPHLSIVAERDSVVTPTGSACFPAGEVVVLPGRGHNSLLFDAEVIHHVTERVRKRRVGAAGPR